MALRVTQSLLYGSSIRGMNRSLGNLMESNLQASSQKKINRPSDDPTGSSRVLAHRSQIDTLARYQSNIDLAAGWLGVADSTLAGNATGSVQAILTSIKTLDLQGSTGTVNDENRLQVASSLRAFYEQLVNLANQEFDGKHIFAGHKINDPAYTMALGLDCLDPNSAVPGTIGYVNPANPQEKTYFHVEGSASRTVLIQAVGPGAPGSQVAAKDATYRYSADGGKTWQTATVTADMPSNQDKAYSAPPQCRIEAGGVSVMISDQNTLVTTVDTANEHSNNNGTWLYVRPTAIYQGDDNDTQVTTSYGAGAISPGISRTATSATPGALPATVSGLDGTPTMVQVTGYAAGTWSYQYSQDGGTTWTNATSTVNQLPIPGGTLNVPNTPGAFTFPATYNVTAASGYPQAAGYFTRDVAVRIDDVSGGQVTYSYSLDDGNNWTQTNSPAITSGSPALYHLPIPGGYLNMTQLPPANSQFIVHPHRADIDFQISDTSAVTVNMVGKDIFGGLYNYPGDGIKNPVPVPGEANMFEIVGRLIAMAETNSQQGFQEAMDKLSGVMSVVLTKAAWAGGNEDRLLATKAALTTQSYTEEESLSNVEDVDVTELMTRLAQQQVAYNSVLKSSSMIMQMSLVNFL